MKTGLTKWGKTADIWFDKKRTLTFPSDRSIQRGTLESRQRNGKSHCQQLYKKYGILFLENFEFDVVFAAKTVVYR